MGMDTNHTSGMRNLITAQKEVVNKIKYIKRRGIKFFFLPDIKALCNLPSICFIGVSTPSKLSYFFPSTLSKKMSKRDRPNALIYFWLTFSSKRPLSSHQIIFNSINCNQRIPQTLRKSSTKQAMKEDESVTSLDMYSFFYHH